MSENEPGIEYTDEQGMLADTAAEFLRDKCGFEQVRRWLEEDTGFDRDLWREMAALGWTGIAIPEAHGGAGLGAAELVAVMEPMGKHVMASPFLATTLGGQLLLRAGSQEQQERWLPGIASGGTISTVALSEPEGSWEPEHVAARAESSGGGWRLSGVKAGVLDAAHADVIFIAARAGEELAVFAVEHGQLSGQALRREQIVDQTRRSYRLELDGLELPAEARLEGGNALAAVRHVHSLGWLLVGAELTGAANGVFELTLDYLRTRKQFGKLIGGYQALKHPMVDIMGQIENSRALMQHAASIFAGPDGDSGIAARMLKAYAGDTAGYATDRAVQFHGAFGFTWECNVQLFFRRATWGRHVFGDALHHRAKLADVLV